MPEHTQPTVKRGRGRPKKAKPDKVTLVSVTLSPESRDYLKGIKNKSKFIDTLVKEHMATLPL